MGQPEERRKADELVEPLFAGLRGADSAGEKESGPGDEPRPDPWKHPPHPKASPALSSDFEGEPSTVQLFVKALVFVIALLAIAGVFYFVFGV